MPNIVAYKLPNNNSLLMWHTKLQTTPLIRTVHIEGFPPFQEPALEELLIGDEDGVQYYSYDTSGKLIETTQPDGAKLYYGYDIAGRLIRLRDDEGNAIQYTYDLMSHKRAEIVYGPQGNLRRISFRKVELFCRLRIDFHGWIPWP